MKTKNANRGLVGRRVRWYRKTWRVRAAGPDGWLTLERDARTHLEVVGAHKTDVRFLRGRFTERA